MQALRARLDHTQKAARSAIRQISFTNVAWILAGLILAVMVRVPLVPFQSDDFFNSIKPWYLTIRSLGFAAFGTDFSTYNPPYLYELYLIARFFPDISNVVAIKIPSLIADFICAYFLYKLVAIKYGRSLPAVLTGFAFLFAPTVILNSAYWGQADVLFAAPLVACIYFLAVRKNALAMLAFGIALAFKLQAIFLAPLLLALFLRGRIPWRDLLLVPLVLLLAIVPTWVAGRPLIDLLSVYEGQTEIFQSLGMNAPTAYAWMPDTSFMQRYFTTAGVMFTAALVLFFVLLVYRSRVALSASLIVELSLLSLLLVPFFLPKMHERYFYAADALSIAFAMYSPQFFYVPLFVIAASTFAYMPFLFGMSPVPLAMLALTLLIIIAILTYHVVRQLYPSSEESMPINTEPAAIDSSVEQGQPA